ncbi:MAG: Ig-like domain-containing protein [Rhodoferax sp.]|uniref:Ig-like domain-containing protein n=1 Tax=Rhodoferax sp. TaxID=50421 RepID=UPI002734065B|nr:Ig-like domain-containing protein [Rhodoferax sp.]MDP2681023.1 Ig-like domain-containing protein [Rhodoferax sp.]
MKNTKANFRQSPWLMAMALSGFLAACGGSDQSPIGLDAAAQLTATALSPLPLTTVGTNITAVAAKFSKAMDATTVPGSFALACPSGTAPIAGATSYDPTSRVVTLALTALPLPGLPVNTTCTATVTTTAKDSAGLGLANGFSWTFKTAAGTDTSAPTVNNSVNANNATAVATNAKVGISFNEAMDPATVTTTNFTVKQKLNSAAVTGTASISGVDAVFVPQTNLLPNTAYTATIKGGATGIKDLAGNTMAADYSWSWTTAAAADTTAPRVTDTIHLEGVSNVAINTKVGATFSEALNPQSVDNLSFSLKQKLNGTAVAGATSYSGVNAVFTPLTNLLPNTQYTATVKGGATGVQDLAANAMTADYTWSWTTAAAADTTAPLVTTLYSVNLATNVPVTASANATFNEAMDPLTITTANFTLTSGVIPVAVAGTVSYNAQNKIATFNPTGSLALNTTYTATVTTGVADLTGNALAVNKVWTFTTELAPVVVPVIALNTVAPFGTFGGTAGMTNMGTLTQNNGDIGTIATTTSSITGFHDTAGDIYTETTLNKGAVNGKIYTCTNSITGPNSAGPSAPDCAVATQARLDAQTAYQALVAKPVGGASPAPGANLAGITLQPGTYVAPGGSFMIQGGDLTLDAQGDANATWVFQMASTLTVGGPGAAAPQSIILAGGALAKNVFWQVGSTATINAAGGGTMVGTIIAQAGVKISTADNVNIVRLNGRALSLGASVTMVNTVVNVPAQ